MSRDNNTSGRNGTIRASAKNDKKVTKSSTEDEQRAGRIEQNMLHGRFGVCLSAGFVVSFEWSLRWPSDRPLFPRQT